MHGFSKEKKNNSFGTKPESAIKLRQKPENKYFTTRPSCCYKPYAFEKISVRTLYVVIIEIWLN